MNKIECRPKILIVLGLPMLKTVYNRIRNIRKKVFAKNILRLTSWGKVKYVSIKFPTLRDIAEKLPDVQIIGDMEVEVSGISHDSREIVPGDIYACIPGFKVDGHDFAVAAQKAGAAALLVERFLKLDIPQLKVESTRQTVGRVAAEIYGYPSRRLKLIGVTGTNGKTTVTHLVERIARLAEEKTGMIGTLGAKIMEQEIPCQHTTPESTDIQKLLHKMVEQKVRIAVMEVSSHALDLGRVNGCFFQAGIFTNLSQDHLDYHQDMQKYLQAKSLLFAGMKQDSKQFAVLNADDPSCTYLQSQAACRYVTYGVDSAADYKAEELELTERGVEFKVKYKGNESTIIYPTPGKFSVYNALAAFAWGIEAGYSNEIITKALRETQGVPGRFESIRKGQPFLVIVDYAHTPDGLVNVLSAAREISAGRIITVFGCGGDRDRTKRPLMGRAAAEYSDFVIVTSDNPRTEDPQAIIEDILPGIAKVDYKVIVDRRQAIVQACSIAKPGDTIIIAGKGHEDYQIIGSEKIHFDDREEVEKALRGMGYVK